MIIIIMIQPPNSISVWILYNINKEQDSISLAYPYLSLSN